MTLRSVLWIYGGVVMTAGVLSAVSFVRGDSLAAVELLLFVGLAPGLALFAIGTWALVQRPTWYRSLEDVLGVAFLMGCLMVLVPILIYMPWAPARFAMDEMPFPLPWVVGAGAPLAVLGALGDLVLWTGEAWRKRAIGDLLAGVALIVISAVLVVAVIAQRVSGGP